MARPRRSEHSRQSILEQGVELLSEQGYHGTGLKQILDAVKVPKGSFYNYFPSKEHFVAEVIRHYADRMTTQLEAGIGASKASPAETIHNIYSFIIQYLQQDDCRKGCLLGDLTAEVGGTHPLCTEALQEGRQAWLSHFVVLIEQGQQQGEFRQDISAAELTELFWNLWEGGLLQMKLEGSAEALKRALDLTLNHLFRP
ncbi:TetR/AcrR family transcriptional regulator [Spongorhabdus nitratireducens]